MHNRSKIDRMTMAVVAKKEKNARKKLSHWNHEEIKI